MTTLNEVASLDWNSGMVCPKGAVVGRGIANRLTSVIHRIWDIFNVDLDRWVTWDKGITMEGEDGDHFVTGGCCWV